MGYKLNKFIDWLCGKNNNFPYFKDYEPVQYPIGLRKDEEIHSDEVDDHYANISFDNEDYYDQESREQ